MKVFQHVKSPRSSRDLWAVYDTDFPGVATLACPPHALRHTLPSINVSATEFNRLSAMLLQEGAP